MRTSSQLFHCCYFLREDDGQQDTLGNGVSLQDMDLSRMWEANQRFQVIARSPQIWKDRIGLWLRD